MKKRLITKLSLKKETISKLQDHESRVIKGGSELKTCDCNTDGKTSCSYIWYCCTVPEIANKNG
ncbi:MAG: class I lanthipeptide [Candidatus Aminicenantes bacterium]|nr:class I lanthipeptide [Candidatus Aminicenantes bacterium]